MLKGINKLLTGDLLKILCDMGHGDELVIADANFPAETCAKRLVRLPGIDAATATEAVMTVFPLDTYTDAPAVVMALTESDVKKGMARPVIWDAFENAAGSVTELERFAFYERAKKADFVIQTGEERQYCNLLRVRGVVV
jgi:L-fucose mutarotase